MSSGLEGPRFQGGLCQKSGYGFDEVQTTQAFRKAIPERIIPDLESAPWHLDHGTELFQRAYIVPVHRLDVAVCVEYVRILAVYIVEDAPVESCVYAT